MSIFLIFMAVLAAIVVIGIVSMKREDRSKDDPFLKKLREDKS